MLGNIGKERPISNDNISGQVHVYWESYVMQFLFLIILACHIPYLYYSGKESLLIIIDETMRKSISYTLSKKLQNNIDIEVDAPPQFEDIIPTTNYSEPQK